MEWKHIALEMEYLTTEERTLLNQLWLNENNGFI